ncbi:MAG TPA: hypothetical protein V6C71_27200 [Coleofasciculaceae cyanobacterium]|jgi:hypothetical protein
MSDRISNTFLDSIVKLSATGDCSFEGLIAELLESLTGRHFNLAKPGYQAGRDMSSRDFYQNTIFVECKRYKKTTELNERELLGELDQAKAGTPDLDVWVLVTSRDVDSKLYESLHRSAAQKGIDFAVIADGDGKPSYLAVLCANSPATAIKFLKLIISLDEDLQKLENELDEIAKHPQFSQRVNQLKEKFLSPLVGYENWRVEQNQKLLDYFKSEKDSRPFFGQPIDVEGENVRFIERTALTEQLDSWYSTWGKHRNVFAVLGEEGDGKTWGVARWLGQKIQQGDKFPGVVFISSNQASNNDPYILFSEIIARNFSSLSSEQCNLRIKRWIEKTTNDDPILLLVLDGINERRDFEWWRSLIDCLVASPWRNSVAVLITCRDRHWQSTFGSLRYLSTNTHKLPPYSEEELTEALRVNKINRSQLSQKLFESQLLHKPRFFNLVIKYQERIGDIGNITIARLIYEDWKDRLERKSNIAITDAKFQAIIKDLVEKTLEKAQNRLKEHEIEETFSFVSSKIELLEEFRTGSILEEKSSSRYEVKKNFLTYGLGLLLVENLADAAETGEVNLEEAIAQWLEPHAGMDLKGEICHFASLISLGDSEISQEVKVTLLLAWVNSQNPRKDIDSDFIEYFPVDPEAYIDLAEKIWSYQTENPWAQELLMRALIRWRENEKVIEKLIPKLEKWLGFVHLDGFPHSRRASKNDREIEQIREDIFQCIGQQLKPGQVFTFNGYQLTAIDDDGLLRLGRVALRLIDYLPVKPLIKAIATGAMAEAIMGCTQDYQDKYNLFQWIFASADDNLWNEIKLEVESLRTADNLIANRVAYFLLSWEGSTEAFGLRETLPQDLFPKNPWIEKQKQDICQSWYRWSESDYVTCLKRSDLTLHWVAQKVVPHCLNPVLKVPDNLREYFAPLTEQISIDSIWSEYYQNSDDINFKQYEAALYAYAPDVIADLVRKIIRGIVNRSEISLRQLCFKLKENYLIFDKTEKQSIYRVWQQFKEKCDITEDLEKVAEAHLFKVVLEQLEPKQQLDYFLQRPETASDLISLERSFKSLQNSESVLLKLDRLNDDTSTQRTLWFLSTHQENLTAEQIRQHIYPFVENENSFIRSQALKILYQSKDTAIIQHFINSSWQSNVQHHDLENHWGNLLLCQYGQKLSFLALKDRVYPSFLGIAIRDRGLKSAEVKQYADYIDLLWTEIKENVPELPLDFPQLEIRIARDENFTDLDMIYLSDKYFNFSETFVSRDSTWGGIGSNSEYGSLQDFDEREETRKKLNQISESSRKEQLEANNCFFNYKILRDVLSVAIAQRPDLVDKWLEPIQGEQNETVRKVIRVGTVFYETLCYVLLERSHARAIELYRYLSQNESQIILKDAQTNTRYLDYALFQASPTESLEQEWLHQQENCHSDAELLELAIVAQLGQGESWLLSRIEQQLQSSAPRDFSHAVTMLGFLATDDAFEQLKKLATSQPDTWRKRLVEISMERWQRNSWAKHWFREFLTQGDRVMAWRGFRLFLQCGDKRFWLWKEELIGEASSQSFHQYYLNFLEDNTDTIKNAIGNSKYNQELEKTFLAHKTTSES